ncbi:class I SAM-dependent methyltransferase, partial [Alphaproteobacteria bacterium]|nr:class I SAM-dependent methyltransferase [Alphaproteobacteria bacterium]
KRCLNIDSGRIQAQESQSKGIPTVREFFNEFSAEEIKSSHGQAKIIHGSGVLFHLEELHSAFSGIKSLLAPDGMLVAEFIYLPEMVNNCAYDQIYHEHLLYYSLTSLSLLLKQHDLQIFDAELAPIHGGTCIAKISHFGQYTRTQECENFFRAESAAGVNDFNTYKDFGIQALRNRDALAGLISNYNEKGMKVHALGAPVKGSTIVNFCGFDIEQIACAVEINPYKFNTKIPGTRIPVFDEHQTETPDAYLLLSWNFKDEILENFTHYRQNGGQIVNPIPTPEII